MTGAMKATVVFDDRVDRVLVETVLTSSRDLDVSDFLEMSGFEPDHGGAEDVLIIACDDFTPLVGDYLGATSQRHPTRPVILLCAAGVNGHVGEAMGAGADDILTLPKEGDHAGAQALSSEVAFSVEKALARKHGTRAPSAQKLGRMVCVLGLKGGSGKTLTAGNLAVSLASSARKVALIDLDLQFGDIGLALGLSPERTLYDLVRSGGSLDAEKLEDFLAVHPSGVRALLAPVRPDQAGIVTPEFLKEVYRLLLEMHDYVIVDTPPAFTPEVIGAVDTSSEACVVSMLDSPSLKNSKLGIETLELMDYQGRVRVVLNRADSNVGITPEDVVAILGRKPDVLIPSDRNVVRAVNQGEPIAMVNPRSDAARAFRVLAGLYLADEGSANGASPRRRLLRGRRGGA
jgi:pilus assembly protein CpaE